MLGTPWQEFVTREPGVFHLIGGAPDTQVEIYLKDRNSCFGHPTQRNVIVSRDGCRSFGGVFLYDFTQLSHASGAASMLFAHPFALAHLYAAQLAPGELIARFAAASSGTDVFLDQSVQECQLNVLLGMPAITLVLGTQFDLALQ